MSTNTTGKPPSRCHSNNITILDSDLAGESQASQVLKNALGGPKLERDRSTRNTIPVDEPEISKDLSSDSINNSHSAPQYHYHGLATTQTQSQQYDDESNLDEGENITSNRETLSCSGNQALVDKPSRLAPKARMEALFGVRSSDSLTVHENCLF